MRVGVVLVDVLALRARRQPTYAVSRPEPFQVDDLKRHRGATAENAEVFVALASLQSLAGRALLSAEECRRCDGFMLPGRQQAFCAGRTLLRLLIETVKGVDPREIHCSVGGHGRLLLDDGAGRASLSHSGQWVAAAYAAAGGVGIDVQALRPVQRLQRVAQRLFARPLVRWIARQKDPERAFLDVFSAAESLGKALGTGWAGGAGRKIMVRADGRIQVQRSLRLPLEVSPLPTPEGYVAWVCHAPAKTVKPISIQSLPMP